MNRIVVTSPLIAWRSYPLPSIVNAVVSKLFFVYIQYVQCRNNKEENFSGTTPYCWKVVYGSQIWSEGVVKTKGNSSCRILIFGAKQTLTSTFYFEVKDYGNFSCSLETLSSN